MLMKKLISVSNIDNSDVKLETVSVILMVISAVPLLLLGAREAYFHIPGTTLLLPNLS